MKNDFYNADKTVKYEIGGTIGREQSRGYGRDPKRTLYREWTLWFFSSEHRAWVHDGKFTMPIRSTRKQIEGAT